MKTLLHLGSGKVDVSQPIEEGYDIIVHVDKSYSGMDTGIAEIEQFFVTRSQNESDGKCHQFFIPLDLYEFLDTFKFKFDKVIANRIAEHQFFDNGEIGRFLDACNQITIDDGKMDLIVPNFDKIIDLYTGIRYCGAPIQNSAALIINTELCNTRCDPHGSIWSPAFARYYIGNEGGTWKIQSMNDIEKYKGRSIYMKIELTKKEETKDVSSSE